MSIPLNAIDPDAHHRSWLHEFEWHLDIVPPLIDAIIMTTLPTIPVSRGGSRFDRDQVTGGGYHDTMTPMLMAFDQSKHADGLGESRAVGDAKSLWFLTVEYTRAVAAWVNVEIDAPYAPDLPPLYSSEWAAAPVDADPIGARAHALSVVGWLIEHADFIRQQPVLVDALDELFTEIRHLRGVYGVQPTPRRERQPRATCTVCGARAVVIRWVDDPNGSPKPVRAGVCRVCEQTYHDPAKEAGDVPDAALVVE